MPQVAWAPWRARSDFNRGFRAARTPRLKSNREMLQNHIRCKVGAVHVFFRVPAGVEERSYLREPVTASKGHFVDFHSIHVLFDEGC